MNWKMTIFSVLAFLFLGVAVIVSSTESDVTTKCTDREKVYCKETGKCESKCPSSGTTDDDRKNNGVLKPGSLMREEPFKSSDASKANTWKKAQETLNNLPQETNELGSSHEEDDTSEDDSELEKRVRRNAESSKDISTAITKPEAQAAFNNYSAYFSLETEAAITTAEARQFITNDLEVILSRLCASPDVISYIGDAVLFETQLFTLRMDKMYMADISTKTLDVACGNCSASSTHRPAKVNFGAAVETKYSDYECNLSTCNGTCVATGQISKNFLTALGFSVSQRVAYELPQRRSDVIFLTLINPANYSLLDPGRLSSPVQLTINASGQINPATETLECRWWSGSQWTTDECTTENPPTAGADNTFEVTCNCTRVGYISVFDGPAPATTTTAMPTTTSTPMPTTTTTQMPTTTTTQMPTTTTTQMPTTTTSQIPTTTTTNTATTTTTAPNTATTTTTAPNTATTTTTAPNTATTTTTAPNTATTTTAAPNTATTTTAPPNTATTTTAPPNTASTITAEETTTATTTTTTTAGSAKVFVAVSMTFNFEYSAVSSDLPAFKESVRSQIAAKYNVSVDDVKDLEVYEGSIIIKFTLAHPQASTIVTRIEQDLGSGSLNITDQNGNTMAFVQGSFSSVVVKQNSEEEKKKPYVIIIVAVLCTILVIVLVIILVIFLLKRQNKRSSPSVTPTPCPPYEEGSGGQSTGKKGNMDPTWTEDETKGPNSSTEQLISEEKHYSSSKTSGPQVSASPLPPKDENEVATGSGVQGESSKK